MSETVRKIALSQPETSTLARNLVKAAAAQGRTLTYAQALSETASLLGYANVHEMTAAAKAARKALPKKATVKPGASAETTALTAALAVIDEMENAILVLISELDRDHVPVDGYDALISATTFRHAHLGRPLDGNLDFWREAAEHSRREDEEWDEEGVDAGEPDDGPMVLATYYADGYTIQVFEDRDQGVPAERIEQGNNPAYTGCAQERLNPQDPRAIPLAKLKEMALADVLRACTERGWNHWAAQSFDDQSHLTLDGNLAARQPADGDGAISIATPLPPAPVRIELESDDQVFIALATGQKEGVRVVAEWDQVQATFIDEGGSEGSTTWATFAESAIDGQWGILSGATNPKSITVLLGDGPVEVFAGNVKTTIVRKVNTLSVEQTSTETTEMIGSFDLPV